MRATFKLINSYFWKTIYGPILAFVFPIMLLGILGNILRLEYVYPGIIALTMLFLGVLALPLAIMELKGSSLFKYIGSSPVNPFKFSFVVIVYYIFISILTGLIIMFAAIIIFYKRVFPNNGEFKNGILGGLTTLKGFFSFYIASFLHLILVISSGLAIATFAKTPQQALTISIIIIIPTMFLSGMVVTVDIIARSSAMQWISRFNPFRYSTGNLVIATTSLDQIGDIFSKLTIVEKEIIFGTSDNEKWNVVNKIKGENYGNIKILFRPETDIGKLLKKTRWVSQNKTEGIYLKSSEDIKNFIIDFQSKFPNRFTNKELFNKTLSSDFKKGDWILFKTILLDPNALNNSDNNIFNLNRPWSVRKILEPSQIKEFLHEYLMGERKGNSKIDFDVLFERYSIIIVKISEGDLRFIDMFTKKSIELYSLPERSLNLFSPLFFSSLFGIYVNKKFAWSSR